MLNLSEQNGSHDREGGACVCVLNNISPPAGTSASYRGHAEEPDDKHNQRTRVTTGGYRGPHGEPLPEDGSVGWYDTHTHTRTRSCICTYATSVVNIHALRIQKSLLPGASSTSQNNNILFFLLNSFSSPQWDPVKFTALCVCVCAHRTL